MLFLSEKNLHRDRLVHASLPIGGIVGFFILWESLFHLFHISPLVLVPPSVFLPLAITTAPQMSGHLLHTLVTALSGWIIGWVTGLLCAVGSYHIRPVRNRLVPMTVLFNSVPLIALIAILSGILGTKQPTQILITSIVVVFPVFISTLSALSTVPHIFDRLLHQYATDNYMRFIHLSWPHTLPTFLSVGKITLLSAILTAIVTEFFGSEKGIGQYILANRGLYRLQLVWAALFLVVCTAAFLYGLLSVFERLLLAYKR